jgi:hypothetical protein
VKSGIVFEEGQMKSDVSINSKRVLRLLNVSNLCRLLVVSAKSVGAKKNRLMQHEPVSIIKNENTFYNR